MYEGTWESVRTHRVPVWYDDAKLGIFIHWGLYSVPGWAPRVPDIQQLLVKDGPKRMLRENPYAEWYRNSMRIKGSPTQRAPRRGLRRGLPLRQLRPHVRRRLVGRRPRRHRRPVPGGRRPLRRADHQAPRRLRTLALVGPAPGQGRVPGAPRPGRRPQRGGPRPAHAHGALLLRRLRLALQRCGADHGGRRRAGRPARAALRGLRDGARARAHRPLPAVGALERHLMADGPAARRSSSPTTTTRSRRASSTTAGRSPACRAMP